MSSIPRGIIALALLIFAPLGVLGSTSQAASRRLPAVVLRQDPPYCGKVRLYVGLFGRAFVEDQARKRGYSEKQIRAARKCLK